MSAQALEVAGAAQPEELYVRHAHKNGRSIVSLRALDCGDVCIVEVRQGSGTAAEPASHRFGDVHTATAFVTEAVEALMYLGCDIRAE